MAEKVVRGVTMDGLYREGDQPQSERTDQGLLALLGNEQSRGNAFVAMNAGKTVPDEPNWQVPDGWAKVAEFDEVPEWTLRVPEEPRPLPTLEALADLDARLRSLEPCRPGGGLHRWADGACGKCGAATPIDVTSEGAHAL